MLGYIISDKDKINVFEHEIKSFDILHNTTLNIFVVENNKILYKNKILYNACKYNHVKVLKWYKKSGYTFEYVNNIFDNSYFISWPRNKILKVKHAILKWFKKNNLKLRYSKQTIRQICSLKNLYFWYKNINTKKIIKFIDYVWLCCTKQLKFKIKHNYLKGYSKN
jgi:hypothetical protein